VRRDFALFFGTDFRWVQTLSIPIASTKEAPEPPGLAPARHELADVAAQALADCDLGLTRFGGHPESLARGAADAKNTSTVFAAVSPADGRPRPCWM